jgi:hypothetical protein
MNATFSSTWTRLALEFAMVLSNGVMAVVLYVARTGQSQAGFAANNLESLSQLCFVSGLIVFLLLASAKGKICKPSAKVLVMLAATLWNQAWVAAFVMSNVPFRLF